MNRGSVVVQEAYPRVEPLAIERRGTIPAQQGVDAKILAYWIR